MSEPVEQLFSAVAERLLREDAAVDQGRMLRSTGLRAGGKFFAFARDDELVVKVPADRVDELVASGAGEPFFSGGRRMREWVCLRPADEQTCAAHVGEARRFATR